MTPSSPATALQSEILNLPLDRLRPSKTNPRRRFDQAALEELARSMAPPLGILEPLVVRPYGTGTDYEIIAGERRWKAARLAKLATVPVVIRDLSDVQVITAQLVENHQREDVHPYEKGVAIDRLLKLDPTQTTTTIAESIGVDVRTVQNMRNYLRLVDEVRDAFLDNEITAAHADLIHKLAPDDQRRALKEGCFTDVFSYGEDNRRKTEKRRQSSRELDDWIKSNVVLNVKKAGKGQGEELLPEVQEAIDAAAIDNAATLLQLSDTYDFYDPKAKGPTPLTRRQWALVKKGEKCDYQQRGVFVLGPRRGQVVTVCVGVGKCKKHFSHTIREKAKPATAKQTASERKWVQQRAEQAARAKLWVTVRPQAIKLAREKVATLKPGPVAFGIIASQMETAGMGGKAPKQPTFTQLMTSIVTDAIELGDADAFLDVAKPLGIDAKKLFAAAAPKPEAKKKAAPAKKRKAGKKR